MEHLDTFLARWSNAGGSERANYQLFLTELCQLLELPQPEPAGDDTRDNAYVFERRVVINQPDGSSNNGFIDLYKRGSFVLEAKQTGKTLDSSGWDKAMLRAHNQADQYVRALPAEEGRPPFILVVDVGRNIELYAEFSRSGATYTPFPDARSHRIRLQDLDKQEVRERLRAVWHDPLALDPARRSAKVTREIADQLAKLAKSLEAAALTFEGQGKHKEAVAEIRTFHRQLCEVRVLDPACGSGNFLYVTLEHMKRLEGEVLGLLHDLGESQGLLELEGITVDPHQFLGLEINPRAARIAEMVLWIGYLQWHYRTHGSINPPEPVLRDFKNIENRDALIAYDACELLRDDSGKPITRWDGITTKISPITGELVPDESAQVEQYLYSNPRKAQWPQADYIVGNPPFIGASTMRRALGDGYVDAVRRALGDGYVDAVRRVFLPSPSGRGAGGEGVPESADFVMYWWHIAAETVRAGEARQFGFITTNSIKQTFNRRVVQAQLEAKNLLSLAFAIPDHPWVDAADGAAVRIAMTVGSGGGAEGRLLLVREETAAGQGQDEIEVSLQEQRGTLFADLKIGANVPSSKLLQASLNLSSRGVQLIGSGFIVTPEEATHLGLGSQSGLEQHIRHYRNGRDLTQSPRGVMVVDLFGLSAEQVRDQYPAVYQHVLERVKPERDQNNRAGYRDNWWLFGEARKDWRNMATGLPRYIATVETTKHRLFQFLDADILPDNMLVNIASDDALPLGVLSSRIHCTWALAAGGTLEDRPRYNKSVCFETFPFPEASPEQQAKIRDLAERLDAHRKRQQAQHPELTLTGIYNVLEKIRSAEPLNAKEKTIHEQGLVSVLRELHDELDRAVFAAYGWEDLADQLVGKPGATTPLLDKIEAQAEAEEELLRRLVALNAERAAEEARGLVRWLRPDYQSPNAQTAPQQSEAALDDAAHNEAAPAAPAAAATTGKLSWPKPMREQIAAVRQALGQGPLPAETIVGQFKRSPKAAVQAVLDALQELGMVQQTDNHYRLAG